MRVHSLAVIAPVLGLASALAAQAVSPFGSPTAGSGGVTPRIWVRGEPRVGNTDFRFTLERGLAQAPAVLVLSSARADLPLAGARLLVDPLAPLFAAVGPITLDGNGAADQVFGIPDLPVVEGFAFFAQWLVADPGAPQGLSSTDGLRLTVRSDVRLLATLDSGLESLTAAGISSVQPWSGGVLGTASELALAPDGQTVVARQFSTIGGLFFELYDVTAQTPTSLTQFVDADSVAIHPDGLAYFFGDTDAWAVDVTRASPTFGRTVAFISDGFLLGPAHISADGRVMISQEFLFNMAVIDVDAASPTRHTILRTFPLPPCAELARVAADGRSFFALRSDSSIGQFDIVTGQLLGQTVPFPSINDIWVDPRGRYLLVSNSGADSAVVDLEPGPGFLAVRTIPTGAEQVAMPADGATIMTVSGSTYTLYDFATGLPFWTESSAGRVLDFVLK